MYVKTVVFFALLFGGVSFTYAQQYIPNDINLVPNPSFETVTKKVKGGGQIQLAAPWFSPTMEKADLFTKKGKDGYTTPKNFQGEEQAYQGSNYVGVRFFGYRNRLSRSYIEVKLKKPLVAGKSYCVKFFYSLSDGSKFGCNNISAYLSKDKVQAKNNNPLKNKPQIQLASNPIMSKQFYWTPICGTFKAEGGEQYLVIGNFSKIGTTKFKSLRRSRDWMSPQTRDAYYFIDQVSVVPSGKTKCNCNISNGVKYSTIDTSFASNPDAKQAPQVDNTKIHFKMMSFTINQSDYAKMDTLAKALKGEFFKNSNIEVIGCKAQSESKVPKLAKMRADKVSKYLQSKGIKVSRITEKKLDELPPKEKAKDAGSFVIIKLAK